MNELQKKMLENPTENMGWCTPYKIENAQHKAYLAVNEGELCSLQIDSKKMNTKDAADAALILGLYINDGYTPLETILNSPNCHEIGCADCPCFKNCEAFEE